MTAGGMETVYKPGPNAVDITPNKDGGVLKEIIKKGEEGVSPSGSVKVIVHYVGKLDDGSVFDSSRERGETFSFQLGHGQVIKGWDIGVAAMNKGEVAMLTCREDYAYGSTGSLPKILPGATLYFEVELIDWELEDLSKKNDKGILRHPITKGEGAENPREGDTVTVSVVGEVNGKEFFNKPELIFCLGEGAVVDLPVGVERAIEHMTLHEKSKFEIKPSYAFGSNGHSGLGVPRDSTVFYTVTLQSWEKQKNNWMMDTIEKLQTAYNYKEKGTKYFKQGNYKLANKMYKKMLEYIEYNAGFEHDEEDQRVNLKTACHLNMAMTFLKLNNHTQAKNQCDTVLETQPDNVKALFRRGQALLGLNEPELAKLDFQKLLTVEPDNKAAMAQVVACTKKISELKAKEKAIYANMFERFARKDKEKEEEAAAKEPDVLQKVGEWGEEERGHAPTEFEKENPNILMLDKNGDFKDM